MRSQPATGGDARPPGRGLYPVAALAAALVFVGAAQAAPGRRAVAPGRVVFPVDGGVTTANVDGGRATQAVGLPNGGAVLVGGSGHAQKTFYAAALTSTGSLDRGFGTGGVARVTVGSQVVPLQLLRQPDGKLIVVASNGFEHQPLVVVRLNANGGLDQTFGSGGLATTPITPACDGCTTAALAPDGGIVLTGETSGSGANSWALTRLTASGAVDQTFGHEGVETVPADDAGGYDVAVLGDGDIVTMGVASLAAGHTSIAMVTRLTPLGLSEPDFNGGTPAELPPGSGAFAMLVYPDGSVLIGGSAALYRYTSVGALDPTFGTAGVARVGTLPFPLQLLPAAGGAVVALGPPAGSTSSLSAIRVAADGSVDPSLGGPTGALYQPPFGGGRSSLVSSLRPRPLAPLAQNSFVDGSVAIRADGSYLAVGGVGIAQPTGEGEGRSIFDFAALALTPGLTPDTRFGGPAKRLTMKLGVVAQTARTAASRHGIRVRVDLSAPGLARVTVRAHGRVVGQSLLPIFGSGPRTLPVELTSFGASLLRGHDDVHVRATATGRDLVAATAHATAAGTLR